LAPAGVLMTRATSPRAMASTTCGLPSLTLLTASTSRPAARRCSAVPRVATSRNPSDARSRAIGTTAGLSLLFTLMNAAPLSGSRWPAAS